ncbi:MAG: hypothetical protein JO040_13670 [Gemmatimonadetes bacterium]|nr:hypothetical protein [Gemmatimonadota bacterium]
MSGGRLRGAAGAALLLASAACARPMTQDPATAPAQGATQATVSSVEGIVATVGSAPMNVHVQVTPTGGRPVTVTGPLAGEIRRLGGARVLVRGRPGASQIEATDYEVVSVEGRRVVMGVVERGADGGVQLRLADGSAVRLTGGTSTLQPGQKVWVQGPTTVTVQTFGVVRP